jgi:KaiC/GvpD/RAD55 family RecA-like ATPase
MTVGIDKQKLLYSYLCSSNDLFVLTNRILESEYFDPELKAPVSFVKDHFDKYRAMPSPEVIQAETGYVVSTRDITKSEFEYATQEIETFCKRKAIEKAIFASPKLLQEGDYGKIEQIIKDAIMVSLSRNIGTNYFEDPEERLRRMLKNNAAIPTGWNKLDEYLSGGVSRKEMTMLMANSGVGKSILMSNLAVNFTEQKLDVVYISLELSEDVVAKRFDSMFTGISQDNIFKMIPKVANEVQRAQKTHGTLTIKRMPESITNANDIRAYLKEYEMLMGKAPDVLVVDYLDLLSTNAKISAENLFVKDKFVAEEVRSIANDFNLVIITASQMGRTALDAEEHHQGHIQGGISKVNTVDNLIAIIQNETMKAAGEYMLKMIKTRSSGGVGKALVLGWNSVALRVLNLEDVGKFGGKMDIKQFNNSADPLAILNESKFNVDAPAKPAPLKPNQTTQNLLDLMRT